MRDYSIFHLDINWNKGTACSKKEYDVNEHERLSNTTLRHRLK
jgi:hypothetical protein